MPNKKTLKTSYPLESAGARMTVDIPVVHPEDTIGQTRQLLREKIGELETINYIYVTDSQGKLVGVFSVKEVFQKSPDTKVKDIMDNILITARARTDQEKVAILAMKHNLKAIPVVDKEGVLFGVVPSDIILQILQSEAGEDIFRLAGTQKIETQAIATKSSVFRVIKIRLPWLLIGLLGGIVAARLIGFFEDTLKTFITLAAFIPIMTYMGDAAGVQTSILFIRGSALDSQLITKFYFLRELKVGFLIALICGLLLSGVTFLLYGSPVFGLVIGLSMFCAIVLAILIGMFIPWLLDRLRMDPALGSGPVGTVIRDILSLLIYFTIASALLHLL